MGAIERGCFMPSSVPLMDVRRSGPFLTLTAPHDRSTRAGAHASISTGSSTPSHISAEAVSRRFSGAEETPTVSIIMR